MLVISVASGPADGGRGRGGGIDFAALPLLCRRPKVASFDFECRVLILPRIALSLRYLGGTIAGSSEEGTGAPSKHLYTKCRATHISSKSKNPSASRSDNSQI